MKRPSCSGADGLECTADGVPPIFKSVCVVAGLFSDAGGFSANAVFVGNTNPPSEPVLYLLGCPLMPGPFQMLERPPMLNSSSMRAHFRVSGGFLMLLPPLKVMSRSSWRHARTNQHFEGLLSRSQTHFHLDRYQSGQPH